MADITMCSNQECISGDFCERQTAKRNPRRQSFAFFCGTEEGWTKCDHYRPNDKARTFDILAGNNTAEPVNYLQEMNRMFRNNSKATIKILDAGLYPAYHYCKLPINKEQTC